LGGKPNLLVRSIIMPLLNEILLQNLHQLSQQHPSDFFDVVGDIFDVIGVISHFDEQSVRCTKRDGDF
jgi:hypothetical protein